MEQPKIPTLKDAQKPQVKIKGMGAGLTLFDRLKQFKKKDLAFILAGLGTLFMAPLAEHFMMAPENGDHTMQKGWGGGSGNAGGNMFGNGSSPYENGNNSIAQGGAIGGAGDIITPLNVRDPSALVMGPGGTQQPNAGSVTPPTAPPTAPPSNSEDLKDALKASASRGLGEAVKKAPLPIPKIAVGGSGLRGLGVAGGGSSASGGMAPLSSGNLGTAGTGGGGLNLVRSNPNFRGAAGPRGNGPQGLDGTKRAGQNAGDAFSRTGSALSGLNAAASEQIPTGGSGFNGGGQGGAGANDKNPGGSGAGGSKSVGESLAFIEAKERMMENLKLEFEKRKLKDPELLMYGIRNEVVKAAALKVGEGLTKMAMCKGLGMDCPQGEDEYACPGQNLNKGQMTECGKSSKDQLNERKSNCYVFSNTTADYYGPNGTVVYSCTATGKGKGAGGPGKAETAPTNADIGQVVGGFPNPNTALAANSLGEFCKLLDLEIERKNPQANQVTAAKAMKTEVARMVAARDALYGTSATGQCGATSVRKDNKSAYEFQVDAMAKLVYAGGIVTDKGAVPQMTDLTTKPDGKVDGAKAKIAEAKTAAANAETTRAAAIGAMTPPNPSVFATSEFGFKDADFVRLTSNAKVASTGLTKLAEDQKVLLETQLKPSVERAELAAGGGKGDENKATVPDLIALNTAWKELETRAKTAGVEPGKDQQAPKNEPMVKSEPLKEFQAVRKAVDAAQKGLGKKEDVAEEGAKEITAYGAVNAIEKRKKEAKEGETPKEPSIEERKAINDAFLARGSAQTIQISALDIVTQEINKIKAPPAVAAATPVVTAAK